MNLCKTKIKLLNKPTELEFLPRLTKHLKGPKIYIKRDDEGGRSGGGNKLRKYEHIIADALAKNCDTLIIAGHYQSNAARELVGSACQLGLKSIVVCKELIPNQNEAFLKNGNALLMNIMGAEIRSIKKEVDFLVAMTDVAEKIEKEGGKPYVIPFGGSNGLGALGYVDCVEEMMQQCKNNQIDFPNYIYTAVGSGGTMAGLHSGIIKNNLNAKVIGISVLHNSQKAHDLVRNLTQETAALLKIQIRNDNKITIQDEFIGNGYGMTTQESIETIKLLAKLEGIFLCPVYTAKAMTGLIASIKSGTIKKEEAVVFIHTGGSPLLYAYYDKIFE